MGQVARFIADIEPYSLVALDTSPFIYHLEEHPRYADLTQALFERIERGELSAITSVLTLTEVLTLPKRLGDRRLAEAYRQALHMFPNLAIVAIDEDIAERAADLRAQFGLRTPDALQLAVALQAQAQAFITNDVTLKKVTDITVLVLADYAISP